jgi:hypothetical protein
LLQSIAKELDVVGSPGLLGDSFGSFRQGAFVLGNQMGFSTPNELSATILAAMVLLPW